MYLWRANRCYAHAPSLQAAGSLRDKCFFCKNDQTWDFNQKTMWPNVWGIGGAWSQIWYFSQKTRSHKVPAQDLGESVNVSYVTNSKKLSFWRAKVIWRGRYIGRSEQNILDSVRHSLYAKTALDQPLTNTSLAWGWKNNGQSTPSFLKPTTTTATWCSDHRGMREGIRSECSVWHVGLPAGSPLLLTDGAASSGLPASCCGRPLRGGKLIWNQRL